MQLQDLNTNGFAINSEAKRRKKCKDFEEILNIIGSEGRFQKLLLYGVLCPISAVAPFFYISALFILDIPDHWCHIDRDSVNFSNYTDFNYTDLKSWKDLHIPIEQGPDGSPRHSQCKMYDLSDPENKTILSCKNGWEYDKSDYDQTIPSEFNWVCDKEAYPTNAFASATSGAAFGVFLFGILADKYGRKFVFFLACSINLFFRILSFMVPQYVYVYFIAMFFHGSSADVIFNMPILIGAETCSAEFRSWTYAATWMFWVSGNALLPLVAWLTRSWWYLGWVSVIPQALLLLYFRIMPESPRFLITAGRGDEALEILSKIAETNNASENFKSSEVKQMVEDLIIKHKEDHAKRNIGVWTLFQNLHLAKNTILICIAMSLNSILDYGLTLNSTSMAGNQFLNYFLLACMELPASYLAGRLLEKTGRRWTQSGFFCLCTISSFLCAFSVTNPNISYLVIVGVLGMKFGVTISLMVVYLQLAEIFPTPLRSTGSGIATTFAAVSGITCPYIIFTGKADATLPYVILGILSLCGVFSTSCLPETYNMKLPETIEDANTFGKGVKFWSYLPKDSNNEVNNKNED